MTPRAFRQVGSILRRLSAPCWLLVLLILVGGASPCIADDAHDARFPDAPMNEQVIRIPGEDPPAVTLQVTIFRPDGDGPFPLAILNHGATGVSRGNRGERYRLTYTADYFLSRGYEVALPMMRGFAASGGELFTFGCDLGATATANARDIRAVIRALSADPHVDAKRIVVTGQSFGGWNTLALGTLNVPSIKGLINFNGGMQTSACPTGDASLVAAAGDFGTRTKIPSLWFYGENDKLFSVGVWRAMHDRYARSGGHAELVDVGVFMDNSHEFLTFPESMSIWVPQADRFLAEIGMPSAVVDRRYMPTPIPAATQFASVSDVSAVPYLSDQGRELYRKFLERPFPRAFVISAGGGAASMNGGFDPLGRAMAACQNGGARCGVYAIDDHVVWKPFPMGPQERDYAVAAKADQTNTIDFATRLNPDCSPKTLAKFKVVQPPAHGRVDIAPKDDFPKYPASSPLALCDKTPVHGVAVTYTPAKGFLGSDVFSFVDDDTPGSAPVMKITLTVK
jgi:dienelactone hydrolase